jgi:guanylate kinase
VSKTTRSPRAGEQDGVNYFFVSRDEFAAAVNDGDFLEYASVYGELYGTPRGIVLQQLAAGRDVLLEIDTQGAKTIRKNFPGGVFVFLVPPSAAELYARITGRATESPEKIRSRLSEASAEIAQIQAYDYLIINDIVEKARDKIAAVISAEKCRTVRNAALIEELAREVARL